MNFTIGAQAEVVSESGLPMCASGLTGSNCGPGYFITGANLYGYIHTVACNKN